MAVQAELKVIVYGEDDAAVDAAIRRMSEDQSQANVHVFELSRGES